MASNFLDNPLAPETFATAATGFFVAEAISPSLLKRPASITARAPGPVSRVVVGRVVMPVQGAQTLAIGLFDFLEKQGFDFKKP